MLCVGLTGGIASGKSTVAAQFAALGAHVISADAIARSLTAKDTPTLKKIITHFGASMLTEDGALHRARLRERITKDAVARIWLEALLHPLIRQQIQIAIQKFHDGYCVIEIPLLTNKADYPYLDHIILVEAPREVQIQRIMQRDHVSCQQAIDMLAIQIEKETREKVAEKHLLNNSSMENLYNKVRELHEKYILHDKE